MSIELIEIGTLGKNENGWWRCVKTASKLRTAWLKNCICAVSLNELLGILFIYQVIHRLSHLSSLKDLKIFKILSILLHREKKFSENLPRYQLPNERISSAISVKETVFQNLIEAIKQFLKIFFVPVNDKLIIANLLVY